YSSIVVLGGAIVGMLVGLVAGYKGGLFDEGLMRSTDVAYSIPFLVFAIAVAYVISRDFTTLNLSLLILWWPPYARLVRSQVLAVKANMFVEAARAAGASDLRIMFRHILPNTLAPVFVQVSLDLGVVIQIFAALIFIGFVPHSGYLRELRHRALDHVPDPDPAGPDRLGRHLVPRDQPPRGERERSDCAPRARRQTEARPERQCPPEAPRADGQGPRPRGLDDLPGTDV